MSSNVERLFEIVEDGGSHSHPFGMGWSTLVA